MRVLSILVVIAIVLMVLGGWLYFRETDDSSGVFIDREKARQDTQQAVEEGEELLHKAAEGVENLAEDVQDSLEADADVDAEVEQESATGP